GKSFE
ncbi:E1-E2 ATPase family protein, partial [Chlamydia psittaci 84-8471/1]